MNKSLIAFFSLAAGLGAFAQGQINFNTHLDSDNPPIDARFFLADGMPITDGFGQLAIVQGNSFTPLSPAVPFGTGPQAGYLVGGIATAPTGFPGGTRVEMVVRFWVGGAGSTFESSVSRAQAQLFPATLEQSPNALNDLTGLGTAGYPIILPEPTSLALGVLGFGAILLWSRR